MGSAFLWGSKLNGNYKLINNERVNDASTRVELLKEVP